MVDSSGSQLGGSFLVRKPPGKDSHRLDAMRPSALCPPSIPGHDCQGFTAPEGTYRLVHQIHFRSLTPLYNVGTSVSLVSIKYKESTSNNLQRYEPQPGARSFRRIFNHNHHDSDDESAARTPSLSSSSSSFNTTNITNTSAMPIKNSSSNSSAIPIPPSIPEGQLMPRYNAPPHQQPHSVAHSSAPTPKLGSSLEGPSFLSTSPSGTTILSSSPSATTASIAPSSASAGSASTFSFLSRNSSLGRRRTRSNIAKTSSSFVTRIVTNAQLAKILVARTSEDTNLFYNCGASFVWMDAFGNPKEPLSRIIFAKACPTSHDVNLLTRGSDHLDVIIGFTSGDILWFDPLSNKYGRINKGGIMNSSAVTMIKWIQGSESLFMAAFQDGSVMVFDKDKDDEPFQPGNELNGYFSHTSSPSHTHSIPHGLHNHPQANKLTFRVSKHGMKLNGKCNPVTHWSLSNKSITAFAFSPDCQHVAVVGLDGLLRVMNFLQETLCDVYQSYYGGLTCVAWSPDGRYILTGGEDDLVTIWAFREQRIVARCQGHSSWVTGVAFDAWRCDERVYRFASVGEDAKLILWDFSVSALHRPKTRIGNRHRGASVSSHTAPNILAIQDQQPTVHPVAAKNEVAFLQPTMVKTVHADPCVGVQFREDVIVTTDRRGRVNVWQRPTLE